MEKQKRRAVAYVRVSTASKAQLHSYEFQEQYWRDYFADNPEEELVEIYADRGISGSSIYKRPQFLIMLQDAREGKFDVIYTKSVSRFSRNTVQLLEAVRELRDLGIEVHFEKEQISTLQPTSELFMTIAATVAENDLQVDSERQKWSIRHRFENGWISIGSGLYGYTMTKDNNLIPVEREAEVIRLIFHMFLEGQGCVSIARTLNAEGRLNRLNKEWNPNAILDVLSNEKYMGDALMGKTYYINGIKHDNTEGQYGQRYYMEDTHEGIVSKEIFRQAQELRQQKKNPLLVGRAHPKYPFAGLVTCGECGKHFQHKINNSGKKWQHGVWVCATKLHQGAAVCDCTRIKDSVLYEKFVEAYNQFVTERPQGVEASALQAVIADLRQEEEELAGLRRQRLIPEQAYRTEQRRIKEQLEAVTESLREQKSKFVRESDFTTIEEFDPAKVEKFITKVIVRRGTVTFVFYNDVEITKAYSNGKPGNKSGWNKGR